MRQVLAFTALSLAAFAQGCGETANPPAAADKQAQSAPAGPQPPAPLPGAAPGKTPAPANASSAPANAAPAANAPAPPATTTSPTPDNPNREEAQAGVGAQGRDYGNTILTYPIATKFTVDQMLVFQDLIPHAMDLYKAEHNNKGPKTHAQFMREIIEANSIALPELPPGDRYVYDPTKEKLMVEHKVK